MWFQNRHDCGFDDLWLRVATTIQPYIGAGAFQTLKFMAQVRLILTATVELIIELPDSKLKSLIVDGEIDVHKYIDVNISSNFKSDFKRCNVSDLTIDVDDPTISSWETIEKNDGTELSFDGYKLSKVQ